MTKHLRQDRGVVPHRHPNPPQQLAADSDIERNNKLYHGEGSPQSPAYGATLICSLYQMSLAGRQGLILTDCILQKASRLDKKQRPDYEYNLLYPKSRTEKSHKRRDLYAFWCCEKFSAERTNIQIEEVAKETRD